MEVKEKEYKCTNKYCYVTLQSFTFYILDNIVRRRRKVNHSFEWR